jgi:hypothetical protein
MRTRYKVHNKGPEQPYFVAFLLQRGGKLELPGQAVPKPELGNEGESTWVTPPTPHQPEGGPPTAMRIAGK